MSKVTEGALQVPAICNGSVIDHIPMTKVMEVVRLLGIETTCETATIGLNFSSQKLGYKGIIKVDGKHFTQEEVDKLALIAPEVVINVIKDYQVVQKISPTLPAEIRGIVRCSNPKCISNNEPMTSRFDVLDPHAGTLQCRYCNRKIERHEVTII